MPQLPQLRHYRELVALSQEELAERAGISRVSVVRIESGKPAFPGTVRKLAAALGVSPAELIAPEGPDVKTAA